MRNTQILPMYCKTKYTWEINSRNNNDCSAHWLLWEYTLSNTILSLQHQSELESWDANDFWGKIGGKVKSFKPPSIIVPFLSKFCRIISSTSRYSFKQINGIISRIVIDVTWFRFWFRMIKHIFWGMHQHFLFPLQLTHSDNLNKWAKLFLISRILIVQGITARLSTSVCWSIKTFLLYLKSALKSDSLLL